MRVRVRELLNSVLNRDDFVLVDLHTHMLTTHSSTYSVQNQRLFPAIAERRGVDALVQTEHNLEPYTCSYADNILSLRNVLLVPGIELSTVEGHANVIGLDLDDYKKYLDEHERLVSGKSRLKLEHLLYDVRNDYEKEPYMVVFPHAFQPGGVLRREENRKPCKPWFPTANHPVFYEWTNGRRSADTRHANMLLNLIRENGYGPRIVGGSDAHEEFHVGLCGNILHTGLSWEGIRDVFLEGKHIVYHIRPWRNHAGESCGSLSILQPDAAEVDSYTYEYSRSRLKTVRKL